MNQTKLSISITLCCIATILSCCSTEEPFSIENKNSSETPSVNLGKRTPTEAIQLAIDSHQALYGEDSSSSRSSKGLIDISTSPHKDHFKQSNIQGDNPRHLSLCGEFCK